MITSWNVSVDGSARSQPDYVSNERPEPPWDHEQRTRRYSNDVSVRDRHVGRPSVGDRVEIDGHRRLIGAIDSRDGQVSTICRKQLAAGGRHHARYRETTGYGVSAGLVHPAVDQDAPRRRNGDHVAGSRRNVDPVIVNTVRPQ